MSGPFPASEGLDSWGFCAADVDNFLGLDLDLDLDLDLELGSSAPLDSDLPSSTGKIEPDSLELGSSFSSPAASSPVAGAPVPFSESNPPPLSEDAGSSSVVLATGNAGDAAIARQSKRAPPPPLGFDPSSGTLKVELMHKPRGKKGEWHPVLLGEGVRVTKGKGKWLKLDVCWQSQSSEQILPPIDKNHIVVRALGLDGYLSEALKEESAFLHSTADLRSLVDQAIPADVISEVSPNTLDTLLPAGFLVERLTPLSRELLAKRKTAGLASHDGDPGRFVGVDVDIKLQRCSKLQQFIVQYVDPVTRTLHEGYSVLFSSHNNGKDASRTAIVHGFLTGAGSDRKRLSSNPNAIAPIQEAKTKKTSKKKRIAKHDEKQKSRDRPSKSKRPSSKRSRKEAKTDGNHGPTSPIGSVSSSSPMHSSPVLEPSSGGDAFASSSDYQQFEAMMQFVNDHQFQSMDNWATSLPANSSRSGEVSAEAFVFQPPSNFHDGQAISFDAAATPMYSAPFNGANVQQTYLQFSDRRLKTDVRSLTDAIAVVTSLRGKSFCWRTNAMEQDCDFDDNQGELTSRCSQVDDWSDEDAVLDDVEIHTIDSDLDEFDSDCEWDPSRDNSVDEHSQSTLRSASESIARQVLDAPESIGARRVIGFIAQEVREVCPEVVREDPATGYLSVAYAELVPYLVEAFKEHLSNTERLQQQVSAELGGLRAQLIQIETKAREIQALEAARKAAEVGQPVAGLPLGDRKKAVFVSDFERGGLTFAPMEGTRLTVTRGVILMTFFIGVAAIILGAVLIGKGLSHPNGVFTTEVIEARDLKPMDRDLRPDSFVEVKIGSAVWRTEAIWDTRFPSYGETFSGDIPAHADQVIYQLYDGDPNPAFSIRRMGFASLNLSDATNSAFQQAQWLKLLPNSIGDTATGEIKVKLIAELPVEPVFEISLLIAGVLLTSVSVVVGFCVYRC